MSTKRQELKNKRELIKKVIEDLQKQYKELYYESLLLSDETQRYIEEEVELVISKRPKKTKVVLRGYIQWDEKFPDGDTGKVHVIQRHQIVRQDGQWIV